MMKNKHSIEASKRAKGHIVQSRNFERGASFVEMIILIALVAFVAGAAMFLLGKTLVDKAKSTDENMEASSVGR